jgi:hypothetical protein
MTERDFRTRIREHYAYLESEIGVYEKVLAAEPLPGSNVTRDKIILLKGLVGKLFMDFPEVRD